MAARSGQITVTTAGTAVAGPSTPTGRKFALSAMPTNAGAVYVGNNGSDDIDSTNGFPLATGYVAGIVVEVRRDLSELRFDAANNGDKIAWAILEF